MRPKYPVGSVVTPNRRIPKRSPAAKGRVVWLEVGHHFAVVRGYDVAGLVEYDLRDTQGVVWQGVGEIALDPVETEGHDADRGGEGPPARTSSGSLFD